MIIFSLVAHQIRLANHIHNRFWNISILCMIKYNSNIISSLFNWQLIYTQVKKNYASHDWKYYYMVSTVITCKNVPVI